MSFQSMVKTLSGGEIPNLSEALARNSINEALGFIYDETDWSFQKKIGGWNNPGLMASGGSVTVTPYSNIIIGDTVATANWATIQAGPRPHLNEVQFRDPSYTLYDIITYDTTSNPPFATLTLDRPWLEPTTGAGRPYQIYQAYFPVPLADFKKFDEIKDPTFSAFVDFWSLSQDDLSVRDPQRLVFGPSIRTYAVPFDTDTRTSSATLGNVRYEIWPHNLSHMPYSFTFLRKGPSLVNPTDTLLYPLTEELVKHRTREVIYEFKEAQKGEQVQRGQGANWQFLSERAEVKYQVELKKIRAIDANLHGGFKTRPHDTPPSLDEGYSTPRLGQLNVGR